VAARPFSNQIIDGHSALPKGLFKIIGKIAEIRCELIHIDIKKLGKFNRVGTVSPAIGRLEQHPRRRMGVRPCRHDYPLSEFRDVFSTGCELPHA
jgi:hypothetical protein